ncbi:GreA/GreB family elongation factor [Streptomyces shenzhenensis]|uniref:Nucleoside diphosphate kinase regulator n=1 Tax=Streptomyces shenzhenensis TaxID=943815 RepID=A0A3M0HSY1_9ACTN|nr:GreA/GreB family elongation factor [Streptomyces shenzhenensis]RMB79400.1 nucleoside diphosphate kinase regulator [Streptomyces shenzhenensis]
MTGGPEPIGADARRALERELADLRSEREAVASTLHSDGGTGDTADQADELQRATEIARLDDRISRIGERLRTAAAAGPPPADVVGVGSTVTVRFEDDTAQTLQIGEVAAPTDQRLVTADSPLGRALLGRRAGDTVDYSTPDGRLSAVVLSLEPPGDTTAGTDERPGR